MIAEAGILLACKGRVTHQAHADEVDFGHYAPQRGHRMPRARCTHGRRDRQADDTRVGQTVGFGGQTVPIGRILNKSFRALHIDYQCKILGQLLFNMQNKYEYMQL